MMPVQPPTIGNRIIAAINRDPLTAPHALRNDALLAVAAAVVAVGLGLLGGGGGPDALGWVLLVACNVPIVWRRRRPLLVLLVVVACVAPYHALDNPHSAPTPATYIALYTVAVTGRPLRAVLVGAGVLALSTSTMLTINAHEALRMLQISGWVVAVLFCGVDVRFYRQYVASIVERAERAERTREEEARRRVAEERLRIARDLHDLLAHSITLIGVQTSVAAHVLAADPERLDRETVAKALDDIAETCRSARGELRTTLEVLREHGPPEARGPLPGLDGLPDLARAARLAGARVEQTVRIRHAPPAVGAAAYRIVQEALTNAVRHAGPDVSVRVELDERQGALHLSVSDDGTGPDPGGTPGFGLVGMRERARSVGGTLDAGPRPGGGFEVAAVLPLTTTRNTTGERTG
ncbi:MULTISPECIES: sensor histidine kinase [Streptomyces]|uniref:histidine kinase n=1 Tax=Streptomyces koelreuteriae TaxID=2838015 RepID=A0ABX8FX85_9ACTN|nr:MULTISPECIES: sensor histidine kinase [Streptomyces]QWB25709.1 sensor histidine kinase [Streptomyces koelreuteriae]UUA08764.1 sensor histidine kinase [Streptomyces koelreuteriae]UUA16369.1 sensor histidine kinase [Streptomyces sp. CRCS-T-1]